MMSACARLPFRLNSPCCRPLHMTSSPLLTVTVIGYSSILFPTTFASGCTCRIAAFAASNSCMPPSQLEQNVTVYVSPLATLMPEDAALTLSITFPRMDARGGAAATRPRWTAGFDPRGLRSRRADSAAAELSVNADIRAVRGAAPNCIGEDDVTKHLSSRRPAPAYSNVDRAAVTSIRLRSRIVALIANRRPLRGYHRSRREIKKSDCRAVDGAESFTRKRGSKSPLATSVGENGKKIWRSVAVVCSESGCRGLFNISSRASPRPRPFAPHTERAPESRTFALKAKRAKPRAGVRRLDARIPALSGLSTPADAFSRPRLLRWPPQPP